MYLALRQLSITAACAASLVVPVASAAEPTGWAVLFAPGAHVGQGRQHHQLRAVERVAHQLMHAGWPADQVRVLTGSAATLDALVTAVETAADTMDSDESLLIFAATQAATDGEIRLYGSESTAEPESQLALQDLLEASATAPTEKRLLIADFTLAGRPRGSAAADYASLPLSLGSGQFVVINSAEVLEGKDETESTPFVNALVDALAGYAAGGKKTGSGEHGVGLFSLLEYLRLYMQAKEYRPPVIQGSTSSDYVLVSASRTPERPLRPDEKALRERMAATLLHSAERALLMERNPPLAQVLLDRARHYVEDGPLAARVERQAECLLAYKGGPANVLAALERAQGRGEPLFLRLDEATVQYVEVGGERQTRQLGSGVWVKVDKHQDGWLWVTQVFKGMIAGGKIQFESVAAEAGWVSLQAFPARQADSPAGLVERLRSLHVAQ